MLATSLELLFTRLEENFENKLQRQQEILAAEKEALERRFLAIEAQLQTFVTNFGQNTNPFSVNSLKSVLTTDSRITTPLVQSIPSGSELGYVLKPPIFDGKSSWVQYKIRFKAVACANNWNAPKKHWL